MPTTQADLGDWIADYADEPDKVREFCIRHGILERVRTTIELARRNFPPIEKLTLSIWKDPLEGRKAYVSWKSDPARRGAGGGPAVPPSMGQSAAVSGKGSNPLLLHDRLTMRTARLLAPSPTGCSLMRRTRRGFRSAVKPRYYAAFLTALPRYSVSPLAMTPRCASKMKNEERGTGHGERKLPHSCSPFFILRFSRRRPPRRRDRRHAGLVKNSGAFRNRPSVGRPGRSVSAASAGFNRARAASRPSRLLGPVRSAAAAHPLPAAPRRHRRLRPKMPPPHQRMRQPVHRRRVAADGLMQLGQLRRVGVEEHLRQRP